MRFVIKQFTMFGRAKIGSKTGQYPRGAPRGCTSELLDFSGLAGFPAPFRPPVTPELIQTDHFRTPSPKARNPLCRPALRDGVTGWRGACAPLPLSSTKIDRLLGLHDHFRTPSPKARNPLCRPALRDGVTGWRGACAPLPLSSTKIDRLLGLHILLREEQPLGAYSPHTVPCNLGGACALPALPSPHTTRHRPYSGVVMRPCPSSVGTNRMPSFSASTLVFCCAAASSALSNYWSQYHRPYSGVVMRPCPSSVGTNRMPSFSASTLVFCCAAASSALSNYWSQYTRVISCMGTRV